ncbi:hypothetical protein PAXRUDRAFT_531246 [Paxillus rubicundulus Ve08.2h10]|uniref:Uncharacterized protein n=1 Tax=Paxillus rubicundulus Ve08.2h10 TaxID=930991 RepID=A0A0D0BT40_9AGAM|nr:hypothetical protein PAXRUDRAFT_531246 [Paxillus rubicundulus Ve08.2h10]
MPFAFPLSCLVEKRALGINERSVKPYLYYTLCTSQYPTTFFASVFVPLLK